MVVTCDIQLEKNPEAVYYAGQVIMGKVTLTVNKIKRVKAVNLRISGTAKTSWKEKSLKNCSDIIYSGQVDYINTLTCLLAPTATDAETVIIEPGIYTFSFACHIPVNCPTSFVGDFGSISYVLQVSLVRPWKYDLAFMKQFTVLGIKDLNYDSSLLKVPVKFDSIKKFGCGPCKSDDLHISVHLPQTGFVTGQVIPVNILVTNATKAVINDISVRLVMVVDYCSTHPSEKSKCLQKTISELNNGVLVQKNCEQSFKYSLTIPAIPPTCTSLCKIIKISYRLEVEAKIQGLLYRTLCTDTPIIIGNVPLYRDDMVVSQQPMWRQISHEEEQIDVERDGDVSNENREPWAIIENMKAPVYTAAAYIPRVPDDSVHNCIEQNFVPKYPIFTIDCPDVSLQPYKTEEIESLEVIDPNKTTWL